jgi:N-methylhydantoinase B/oxoprolinase/acetone carboxylase alpha subunit
VSHIYFVEKQPRWQPLRPSPWGQDHRRVRPFGLAGGQAGQVGKNRARRKDGRMEALAGRDETVIDADEAVIIQTPTAGGYGKPDEGASAV